MALGIGRIGCPAVVLATVPTYFKIPTPFTPFPQMEDSHLRGRKPGGGEKVASVTGRRGH